MTNWQLAHEQARQIKRIKNKQAKRQQIRLLLSVVKDCLLTANESLVVGKVNQ
jgi:hypothetical protein